MHDTSTQPLYVSIFINIYVFFPLFKDPTVFEEAVMAAGAEQPERLAHYLDLVEVCLLKQISHRWAICTVTRH